MVTRKNIAVLFGGLSAEHGVSLKSAKNIIDHLNNLKYTIVPIAIDQNGNWWTAPNYDDLIFHDKNDQPTLNTDNALEVILFPGKTFSIQTIDSSIPLPHLDAVFPILHGPMGEDGSIQGLLRILDLPFVGSDIAGSANGMDKDIMKRLLRDANIPIGKFITVHWYEQKSIKSADIIKQLGLPIYVKPANMGSSIGISKVQKERELSAAMKEAFLYDRKIILEANIQGREIECAVLGNEHPKASPIGEIIPKDGWYSYQAKYFDEDGAALIIPADLTEAQVTNIQNIAIQTWKALNLEGLSRVDLFLTESNDIYVNEVNTMPGFTEISMYPKLWEHQGLVLSELLDRLIELAIERYQIISEIKISPT